MTQNRISYITTNGVFAISLMRNSKMNFSNKIPPPPWWRLSLGISCVVGILVFFWAGIAQISIAYRFLIACTCLPITFGMTIYYDPRLCFMRMAVATLFTLIGSQLFGGLILTIPVPWDPTLVEIEIPGTHWTASVILAGLTIFFTTLHIRHFHNCSSQATNQ